MTVAAGPGTRAGAGRRIGATPLLAGAASIWLSIIVLLPLAAIVWQSGKGGWAAFWAAITSTASAAPIRSCGCCC